MAYCLSKRSASLAFAAALVLAGTGRTLASEQSVDGMRVVSSDQASRFVAIALNKSIVIDTAQDVSDALVTNPQIANAIVRSKRRIYIIGGGVGQTNVYFYGEDGRQVAALDVFVSSGTPPANLTGVTDAHYIVTVRGSEGKYTVQSCSHDACVGLEKSQNP